MRISIAIVFSLLMLTARSRADADLTPDDALQTRSARATSVPPSVHALAARSLAGPRIAIAAGAVVLTAAPFVAVMAGFASADGLAWLGCEDFKSGQVDEDCEREDRAAQREYQRAALFTGVATAAVGAGLIALGVVQLARIRRARRHVALGQSGLHLSTHSAELRLALRF